MPSNNTTGLTRKREASARRTSPVRPDRITIYSLDHIRAALGVIGKAASTTAEVPRDTEHQQRLAAIIAQGEAGRWRDLVPPAANAEAAVAELVGRAPHFGELGRLVAMHLRSATVIGLPVRLPPILLIGSHGIGKSWFMSRLAGAIGNLPFRRHAMNVASLAEGISGAHGSWRNAGPGLVAKCLLVEAAANPLIFVDESNKVFAHAYNGDPYRPFYSLLDPSDSKMFTDEYLSFPIDASHVNWVMAANDTISMPLPILDRLMLVAIPEPDEAQRAKVAYSIYGEANKQRRGFFEDEPEAAIIDRVAGLSPRSMRKSLDEAMVRASAEGRRRLTADDVLLVASAPNKRIGFCR